jgi:hypothetical protein
VAKERETRGFSVKNSKSVSRLNQPKYVQAFPSIIFNRYQ